MPAWLTHLKRLFAGSCARKLAARSCGLHRRASRLWLEQLEDRCVPAVSVTPHGGPVLTHVQVETIFYGTNWSTDARLYQQSQTMNSFFQFITNSTYMDMLGEYYEVGFGGQQFHVGRGSWTGYDYTPYDPPYQIVDGNASSPILQMLSTEVQRNRAPYPNDYQTLYFVFLPPGITVSGVDSSSGPVAYHTAQEVFTGRYNLGIPIYAEVSYAVVPFFAGYAPDSSNAIQNDEILSSHELAEAVTNPGNAFHGTTDFGVSWWADGYRFTDGVAREIGDLCELQNEKFGSLDGYWVQAEWSNDYTQGWDSEGLPDHRILPVGTDPNSIFMRGNGQGAFSTASNSNGFPESDDALAGNLPAAASLPTYSIDPGQTLTVFTSQGVLTTFSDPNGRPLQAGLQSGPAHGQLTLNADGSFTYTPSPGYSGTDSFQMYAADGIFESNPVTIPINVLRPSLGSLSTREWPVNQPGYAATIPVTNGSGIYSSLEVTGLPAGLVGLLSGNTIVLGGTPAQAGTFSNIVVSLVDSTGASASATYTLVIDPPIAPTIVVTTGSDAKGHSGESLRDAIAQADSDAAQGRSDSIGFAAGLAGQTITLVQGVLELTGTGAITIHGGGQITVSGNNAGLVFQVDSGVQVVLSGLTVTAGGISNGSQADEAAGGGNLSLQNCTVSGNSGIYNNGTLTVTNCVISDNSSSNGGGIWNDGTATLVNSTISGNTAAYLGGGIANVGYDTLAHLTMIACTISENTAGEFGGGIENFGSATMTGCTISGNSTGSGGGGGGIDDKGGTLTLIDSTVSGNSATAQNKGGGGISITDDDATVTAIDSTIVGNSTPGKGGGIYNGYPNELSGTPSVLTLENTIVAGNYAATSPDIHTNPSSGATVAASYSMIGDTTGSGIAGGASNVLNTGAVELGGLGSFGGPTQTIALLPGCPALDTGSNSLASDGHGHPLTSDQRGEPRIVNGTVDMGAFESQGFTLNITSGDDQFIPTAAFFNPLIVSVTPNNPFEPVDGGDVTFTVNPAVDGATAESCSPTAMIANGQASAIATANDVAGAYTISAAASGAAPVVFHLANTVYQDALAENEDGTRATTTVSSLLGSHYSDPDGSAKTKPGIAVVQTAGGGAWQYSRNGVAWRNLGAVSQTGAILLPASDWLRFVPASNWSGQAKLLFFAWDGSQGTAGSSFNITTTGGASAFSTGPAVLQVTVNPVRTWAGAGALMSPLLPSTYSAADPNTPAGNTIASVFGRFFHSNNPAASVGVAVVGLTGNASGIWQYSITGGSSWTPFPTVSGASALLLSANDQVRFVPKSGFAGTVSLTALSWDGSIGTHGTTVNPIELSSGAFSTTLTAKCSVNTAPVLTIGSVSLPAINENVPGQSVTVKSLLSKAGYSDPDGKTVPSGIAIIGSTGPGTWQWLNGSTWMPLPAVSSSLAFLLAGTAQVRFRPANDLPVNTSGIATLTYLAWDQTADVANTTNALTSQGGATAFSTAAATANLTVKYVKQASGGNASFTPVLGLSASNPTPNPLGDTVASVFGNVFGGAFGVAIIAETGMAVGAWQYSTDGGCTWESMPATVSGAAPLYVSASDMLRFVPSKSFNGTVALRAKAWDGASGFSATGVTATCLINTAPVLAP